MAYRRKQGIRRSATFVEDDHRRQSSSPSSPGGVGGGSAPSSPAPVASPRATRFADDDGRRPERSSSLAALQSTSLAPALGGRDTPPAFGEDRAHAAATAAAASSPSSRTSDPLLQNVDVRVSTLLRWQQDDPVTQLFTSTTSLNDEGTKYDLELSEKDDDARRGRFWGVVAQKAKVMLDENGTPRESSHQASQSSSRWSYDRVRSSDSESQLSRRASEGKLDIGGKIKNVLEKECMAVGESSSSRAGGGGDAVSPAVRRLQIRRKACSMDLRGANLLPSPDVSPMLSDTESPQIKASRDVRCLPEVANAMAVKVKLLQRELKTVKADLAFSKERCAQLEEENRLLRDGDHDADEDLIRQQLETLLAEKARLAHENTVYARENRFLREIVEYHQLNMQDVVVVNLDVDHFEEEDEEADVEEEEEEAEDVNVVEAEYDQYDNEDLRGSSASHCVEEEAEHFPLPDVLDTAESLSLSQLTDERMLSTNGGVATGNESPQMLSTNGGDATGNESPRMLSTNGGDGTGNESPPVLSTNGGDGTGNESPRMLSTNGGDTTGNESPRLPSTISGDAIEDEMHQSFKDDESSPDMTSDG